MVDVQVYDKNKNTLIAQFINVQTGDQLAVSAASLGGQFSDKTYVQINGGKKEEIHTSCSQDILGLAVDDLTVVSFMDGAGYTCNYGSPDASDHLANVNSGSKSGSSSKGKGKNLSGDFSLENNSEAGADMEVVPNPNNGIFTIQLSNIEVNRKGLVVQVYDMRGKLAYQREIKQIASEKITVDMLNEPQGAYMVKVLANGKLYTRQIVKF